MPSYVCGGLIMTQSPPAIPARHPATINSLYDASSRTGYGELSITPPPDHFVPVFSLRCSALVVPSYQMPSAFTPRRFCRATTIVEPLEPRPVYFHARGTTPLPSSVAL